MALIGDAVQFTPHCFLEGVKLALDLAFGIAEPGKVISELVDLRVPITLPFVTLFSAINFSDTTDLAHPVNQREGY
ncbi:hypothetical protein BMJ34_15690 [Sinorhizobium medicae]|uniref:Uncharacterized protein n=1 Tax=Sinorhizobium medicae TaxID=110321 RepID=A0ABX4TNJ6_9HYPH|nr:hypothetical protein BMJ34_15690 [Sinorhizobium medicae]PLU03779.1 hypothetical protein BMJ33_12800 [Sinorhizobium medicae]PLU17412.1 hypothetical protein BMJ29_20825 [Sinorhizobium medicae]PLU24127.1 hypothetical protein BMJ30_01735 [Sinorhizobium medicae]PLU31579.1 hypothetical protein BMJ27_21115 [Sinorhizobium medicae]